MGGDNRRRIAVVALLAAALAGTGTAAWAQNPLCPLLCPGGNQDGDPVPSTDPTTTTTGPGVTLLPPSTTEPPPEDTTTTDTTAPPEDTTTTDTTAPPPDPGLPEDQGEGTGGGGAIPPEAQRAIDSIARTAPNDNTALVEGVAALEAVGVPHAEAVTAVYGAFPIHGPAHWSDDWYLPRWTGTTFRHHLGLDMMAPYGTPVASPADGVARISNNALGGLTIRVVQPDGTFWYLAHLSGIVEGIVDGSPVTVGQEVGYVGDSGNARGGSPHLHFAVHPGGGAPVRPKPIVDAMVSEGAARVVDLLAQATATQPSAALVATDLTRRLADGMATGLDQAAAPPRSELLWASAANPNGGAVAVADAAAASLNEGVDWEQRAAEQRSLDLAWSQSSDRAWRVLGPLVPPALRRSAGR